MKSAKLISSISLLAEYNIDVYNPRVKEKFDKILKYIIVSKTKSPKKEYEYLIDCDKIYLTFSNCNNCPFYDTNSLQHDVSKCGIENTFARKGEDHDYQDLIVQRVIFKLYKALSIVYKKEEEFERIVKHVK